MKYKCTTVCIIEDVVIMSPGDIVVLEGNQFYNTTTGVTFRNIPDVSGIKQHMEPLSGDDATWSDVDRFKIIICNMLDTFRRKNHDYGNSFEESLNEEGLAASRIRLGDKWNRYKTLSKGVQSQVNDESIRDTLLDMANYAIMTVMWLDKNNN
jgi:hypothetical protein